MPEYIGTFVIPGAIVPTLADKKREHYGVKKEWVEGFDLIPIIDAVA